MGTGAVLGALRWAAQALRPKRNPLRRNLDRWTAAVMALLVGLALASVPVAAAFGSGMHQRLGERSAAQHAERTPVTARLVEPARMTILGGGSPQTQRVLFHALVTWRDAAGRPHGGWAEISSAAVAVGDEIEVWVDDRGAVVAPPLGADRALASAISVGVLLVFGSVVCCGVALVLVRRVADARAHRAWAREWEVVRPRWDHRGPAGAG
ncbi:MULTISPECIES: hypothetical protein [unclassified Saccharopolyspora]|uniref:Rv1733c family protein n=1 Tax=unclassified Saccharopolyspora TaxID=2646250 RepID=UPI001CD60EBE|nr:MULTISPECIES: hypothetical protein [unclassified Saccharopolyspora]MCA1226408.1 hypothetical protein [Saccharopolyspora sp. 6M]MCA1279158.1 hypothetical protein [Saccharopolyspora sp. 7B]